MRGSGKVWLTAGLAVILAWPGVVIAAASITGTITFDGKVPNLKPLAMDADPACAKKHSKPVPARRWCSAPATPWGTSWCRSRRECRRERPSPRPRLR